MFLEKQVWQYKRKFPGQILSQKKYVNCFLKFLPFSFNSNIDQPK